MVEGTGPKWAKILQMEIDKINNHLPKGRVTLESALQGNREIPTRDQGKIILNSAELEFLASLTPKHEWRLLQLPIILLRRRDLGSGVFTVAGSKRNYEICLTILGENLSNKHDETIKRQILYRSEVQIIRKKLPNASVIALS